MPYGYAREAPNKYLDLDTQVDSLRQLANLVNRGSIDALVRNTALRIIGPMGAGCKGREDECELAAIYDAVKLGDQNCPPFKNGFQYVADSRFADYFTAPADTIRNCLKGACGGDCDDHTALVAALAASLGWRVGLRAWGPKGSGGFVHVYPVVLFPKRPPWQRVIALDTTVPEFDVGDEPPRGDVVTAFLA